MSPFLVCLPSWTFPSATCSLLLPSPSGLPPRILQLHWCSSPRLQARVTAKAMPAVEMAWMKADSRVPVVGQERAADCRGQRPLWGTAWEKRLSLHAGRMHSDGDCSGEIHVRMFTQCGCSQGWESVSDMAQWQGGGRVREKIYQSAGLVPRVGQWDQNAKPGQMGRSFSRTLICVRAFGLLCADRYVSMWKKALATLGMGPA